MEFKQIDSIFIPCLYPYDFFNENPDSNIYIHNFSVLANNKTIEIELNNIRCKKGQSTKNAICFLNSGIITFSYLRKRNDIENYNFEIKQFCIK